MGTLNIRYRVAAVLMIAHGALMELGVCLALIPLLARRVDLSTVGQ
ncbi:hypothetical protein [Cryobacterium sp.]|jgi:hypothetical protein|nr:hypothetical protein [Cryobacterium sp.]MCU1445280.1 hypothetical protein [Cryobacterium sp.]